MSAEPLILPHPEPGETGPYALVGSARAKPGLADALEDRLLALVAPTRQETGVRAYHVHRSRSEPDLFVFYEVWSDVANLEAHLRQPYVQRFLADRHELLAQDLNVTWLKMSSPYAAT